MDLSSASMEIYFIIMFINLYFHLLQLIACSNTSKSTFFFIQLKKKVFLINK